MPLRERKPDPTECRVCHIPLTEKNWTRRDRGDGTMYVQPRCRHCIEAASPSYQRRKAANQPPTRQAPNIDPAIQQVLCSKSISLAN